MCKLMQKNNNKKIFFFMARNIGGGDLKCKFSRNFDPKVNTMYQWKIALE